MPVFKFESKKANFHISGEKLTVVANKTHLETNSLNKQGQYSYPEAGIVAKIFCGFTKNNADGKEHFTYKNNGEISLGTLQVFSAICMDQDLISASEKAKFIDEYVDYQKQLENADKHYYFFADKLEAHPDNDLCSVPSTCL